MFELIYISLIWLIITGIILIRNQFEFKKLTKLNPSSDSKLFFSICIPARNEEKVIARCINSIQKQSYENFEILVLNDESEDKTGEILDRIRLDEPKLTVLDGSPKPDDWLGKPYACYQIAQKAKGDFLIFIDADTWWSDDALAKMAKVIRNKRLDAFTVWPNQHFGSRLEQIVLPLVYYALNSLLVASHVTEAPKWIPSFIRKRVAPNFAAANGQCIGFSRESYKMINGHESVKNEVVEDVELAKNLIRSNQKLQMFNGINEVHCRMYDEPAKIWNGFRKNFLAGFGNNLILFTIAWALHIIVFILPYFILAYALYHSMLTLSILSFTALFLIFMHRVLLSRQYGWKVSYAFTHLLGVLWFQGLALQCVFDLVFGSKVKWKERSV